MRRTFKVVDVTEILMHWYAGRPKAEVARSLGVDDKTVRKYVAPAEAAGLVPGGPPVTEADWRGLVRKWFPAMVDTALRQPTWSHIALHHDTIKSLLGVVPVSVIHQRLRDEAGLEASVASLRRYVRARFGEAVLRDAVAIPRPEVAAGFEAQVDYGYMGLWFEPADGRRHRVWAFSMVMSHSRHVFVWPVVVMDQAAWVEAHVAAFDFFGGCPARLIPDNLATGVTKADLYDPQINRAYAELGTHYGVLIDPARAARPKDKPRIEAVQRYIRSSFFAGRDWPSLAAMRADAERWCRQVAGGRAVRALEGRSPLEVFASAEAPALLPLPMVPFELARWSAPKIGPDAHAKVGQTLYSLPWRYIGTRLDARATGVLVQFYLEGELIKTHPVQAKGRRTDWADLPPERTAFFLRTPTWCRIQSSMVGPATEELVAELLSINALFRLRQAQGVMRFGVRYGDQRLEAACRRALEVGDPSYKTVKGILSAGTENDAVQPRLDGIEVPAWLRGPEGFVAGKHDGDGRDDVANGDVTSEGQQ
ncbi:MAG TPA: IS21 family transposase [Acidimicrobiales bacterium]|nr:IS21 family transposase [Acidimicrobiales bacterium]